MDTAEKVGRRTPEEESWQKKPEEESRKKKAGRSRKKKVGRKKPIENEKETTDMSKVAVVYWSGTGNTAAMAAAVAEGAKEKGAEAVIFTSAEFRASMMDDYNAVAFGCPAMGAEVLEESEFEPMFLECESRLGGKKIALFGSYGWGSGEWMEIWEGNCANAGAQFVSDYVICNGAPDEGALADCRALGAALAAA